LYGQVLVAPKEHREQVTADFTLNEYVHLQTIVHRVGEGIRRTVPTDRLYVLSLGSQQSNSHVHWHLAPLPPGIPLPEQQFEALHTDSVLKLSPAEQRELAGKLRRACASSDTPVEPTADTDQ
jgi:ATP adenylyltransferase